MRVLPLQVTVRLLLVRKALHCSSILANPQVARVCRQGELA